MNKAEKRAEAIRTAKSPATLGLIEPFRRDNPAADKKPTVVMMVDDRGDLVLLEVSSNKSFTIDGRMAVRMVPFIQQWFEEDTTPGA